MIEKLISWALGSHSGEFLRITFPPLVSPILNAQQYFGIEASLAPF